MKEFNYCLRCGRKLKNINARLIGYGNVCLAKMRHSSRTPLFKSSITNFVDVDFTTMKNNKINFVDSRDGEEGRIDIG